MYDSTNVEIARFNFTNGWPSKIATDQLSVDSNDPVKETITLSSSGSRGSSEPDAPSTSSPCRAGMSTAQGALHRTGTDAAGDGAGRAGAAARPDRPRARTTRG